MFLCLDSWNLSLSSGPGVGVILGKMESVVLFLYLEIWPIPHLPRRLIPFFILSASSFVTCGFYSVWFVFDSAAKCIALFLGAVSGILLSQTMGEDFDYLWVMVLSLMADLKSVLYETVVVHCMILFVRTDFILQCVFLLQVCVAHTYDVYVYYIVGFVWW